MNDTPLPIYVPCEGAGCPPTRAGTCQMCGAPVAVWHNERVIAHLRKDILAMLNRGDFG